MEAPPLPQPPTDQFSIEYARCNDAAQTNARLFYEAYIANSGGKAWDGRPCPTWEELARTETGQRVMSHWCAVVYRAYQLAPKSFSDCRFGL